MEKNLFLYCHPYILHNAIIEICRDFLRRRIQTYFMLLRFLKKVLAENMEENNFEP